ncbi:sensor histidine kinase [Acidaminobacter hydrogenoformans]|uniref:histidine kinase n=1 Tax=Acidaminobacter hydrogenoformans DSM 2784 TaxID=1120920 RepID=A0A1G5S4D4_9FIRM|nr:sensor histidine kinase [Acidaminobacter hydrogenoformans]SCZ81017.1 Two-component sensor histidine kinase, contains HisKA and HATPase domains [Acidaminobacter hydrogenoformans DSM 2784]
MNSTTPEVSRQLCEDVVRLIADGWHPLLSCFQSMQLRVEGTLPVMLSSDSLERLDPSKEENGHALNIMMNGAFLGTFTATQREGSCTADAFLTHLDQAALLRLEDNPDLLLPNPQCLLDAAGEVVWRNGPMAEIARVSPEPLQELLRGFFNRQKRGVFNCQKHGAFDQKLPANGEALQVSEIEIRQYRMLAAQIPVRFADGHLHHFITLSDNAPDPKSAVIKEIHHRVKNNLQTIASLLRLQMRRVNSKKVENAFNESINRISSIALIHEELSRGGIDKINIKAATANIMEMVLTSMVPPGKNITGELSGSDLYQDADKASSLSLCITELIQNSVEHAFQMRKKGVIKVDISEVAGEAVITISDNGIGFGGKKSKSSLGLEIIEMITVEKLKGTFEIHGQINGTTSVIRFPLM